MPVGVVQDFNSWSCPSSWGVMCLLGLDKEMGREARKNGCKSPGLRRRRKRGPCSLIQCCRSPPWGCSEECWAAGCEVKLVLEITGLPACLRSCLSTAGWWQGLLGQGWDRGDGVGPESVHTGFQGVEGVHEVGSGITMERKDKHSHKHLCSPWSHKHALLHPEAVDSSAGGMWWAARAG